MSDEKPRMKTGFDFLEVGPAVVFQKRRYEIRFDDGGHNRHSFIYLRGDGAGGCSYCGNDSIDQATISIYDLKSLAEDLLELWERIGRP